MGSAASADCLSAFLAFSLADQLHAVATWSVRALRKIKRLHGEAIKADGYPTMERRIEQKIGERIVAVVEELESIIPLPLKDQIARVDAMPLPELADLLATYTVWAQQYGTRLRDDVQARMRARLTQEGR